MRAIHIANEKKRDAEVAFDAPSKQETIAMVLPDGREKIGIKFIKTLSSDEQLKEQFGDMAKAAQAIIDGDPEIDMEQMGRFVKKTLRIWMTAENKIAYRVNFVEALYNPDGSEKQRRDLVKKQSNVRSEDAIQWTGKSVPKAEALRKFVFTRSYQLRHTSGLSYDFLYDMAKNLHESKSLMRLGAGKKGNEQICLSEGGEKYFGFLEGRIDGDKYCLILRLTNMELKAAMPAEGGRK
ncbi:MAG: hypothetical protein FWH35_00530 [Treponema sp.]|nr:hypothetical protein [Treponema sp.]